MKYLPVLQELLESDLYLFFLICAVFENVRTNYMLEIVLLILGVLALGAAAGYLIEFIFHTYKINVRRRRADGSGQK